MGPDAERIDLDGAALKIDPARLADEAASISLFGGARWIRVTLAGDEALPAIEGLLQAAQAGNPVIAIGGTLKQSSKILNRKSVVLGTRVAVRVKLGGRRIMKK